MSDCSDVDDLGGVCCGTGRKAPQCSGCAFSHSDGDSTWCRKNPPVIVDAEAAADIEEFDMETVVEDLLYGTFPKVSEDWWCGEWRAKPALEDSYPTLADLIEGGKSLGLGVRTLNVLHAIAQGKERHINPDAPVRALVANRCRLLRDCRNFGKVSAREMATAIERWRSLGQEASGG